MLTFFPFKAFRMARRLHYSIASEFKKRISAMNLSPPQILYVGNVNGRAVRTKELVANDLAKSIAHEVRCHDTTAVLQELGCNLFLEAGNMLAKQLEYLAGAEIAGIVLGSRVPIVLTSRADKAQARLASCAIALMLANAGTLVSSG